MIYIGSGRSGDMPRICLMSDSHENVDAIRRAVDFFNSVIKGDEKNSLVVHAGDIISPIMANLLAAVKTKIIGVFGNNDGEKNLWRRKFADFPSGIEINERYREADFQGKKILILHEPYLLDALADSGKYDFIFYGHTHIIDIRKMKNGGVIVNPGEVCGYITGKSTCAVIDIKSGKVSVHDIYNPQNIVSTLVY